jgi:hypothetical protein
MLLVWYQSRPALPFRHFSPASLQIQSKQNCKIYYAPNGYNLDNYSMFMTLHPELCKNNASIFLSGYSKAERIAAFVCDKDARVEVTAFCFTYYYWNRGK